MRQLGFAASAVFFVSVACGPNPNAKLPEGYSDPEGSGGAPGDPGDAADVLSSGGVPGADAYNPPGSGGSTGADVAVASGGIRGAGGMVRTDGAAGGGGTAGRMGAGGASGQSGGLGGSGLAGSGGSTATGAEPCSPAKTITSTNTGNFGTKNAFCFRTNASIGGWGCSNLDGRTIKVNNATVTCSAKLPAKVNGYYYFDVSAGTYDYASIYWY